jgi:hypothetical protein
LGHIRIGGNKPPIPAYAKYAFHNPYTKGLECEAEKTGLVSFLCADTKKQRAFEPKKQKNIYSICILV